MPKNPRENGVFALMFERAADELRRQIGVIFEQDDGLFHGVLPVEWLTHDNMAAIKQIPANISLIITATRADSSGIAAKASQPLKLDATLLTLAQINAIANPLEPRADLPALTITPATAHDRLGLALMKEAALLPAFILISGAGELRQSALFSSWLTISSTAMIQELENSAVETMVTAEAKLPTTASVQGRLLSFRAKHRSAVHLALIIGDISANPAPLVRIHSSCVTGDLLGSLRCDCGDQLALALKKLGHDGGVLLYLYQEGRGIGITNKLRAYKLQEQGIDTFEANRLLGFEEDERDFKLAGAMLATLGINRIRLLTNNPHKLEVLDEQNIEVIERVPLVIQSGDYNEGYLKAKAKSGHLF